MATISDETAVPARDNQIQPSINTGTIDSRCRWDYIPAAVIRARLVRPKKSPLHNRVAILRNDISLILVFVIVIVKFPTKPWIFQGLQGLVFSRAEFISVYDNRLWRSHLHSSQSWDIPYEHDWFLTKTVVSETMSRNPPLRRLKAMASVQYCMYDLQLGHLSFKTLLKLVVIQVEKSACDLFNSRVSGFTPSPPPFCFLSLSPSKA